MNLVDTIEHAQGCFEQTPRNETETRSWTIDPLLIASGYLPREITPELKDQGHRYPDYTILPSTSHSWYLEAKAWNVSLEDKQVIQALDYANHNGKRWVVLSNGQCWRLYDNSIQDVAAQKLVTEASLKDTELILGFLVAIGKESVLNDSISIFAQEKIAERQVRERDAKVNSFLSSQLRDEGSPVVIAIHQVLTNEFPNDRVTTQCVREFFLHHGMKTTGMPLAEVNPQVQKKSNTVSSLRDQLRLVTREVIRDSEGVIVIGGSGYRTYFIPSEWEGHSRLKNEDNPLPYIMSFWVIVEKDRVKLALELQPGNQDLRQQLFDYAASHRELFNPGSSTLYPLYSQLYRRDLVGSNEIESRDLLLAEFTFKKSWVEFLGSDFHAIVRAISQCLSL